MNDDSELILRFIVNKLRGRLALPGVGMGSIHEEHTWPEGSILTIDVGSETYDLTVVVCPQIVQPESGFGPSIGDAE